MYFLYSKAHKALENHFDPNDAKRTQELNQIKSDIVQQAMPILYDQIGNYLQDQPEAVKAAVHGFVGGALNAAMGGDFAAGAAAGALTSLVVDHLDEKLKGTSLSKEEQDAVLQLTSAIIGKVSGEVLGKDANSGNMAAFTAMEATEYNYLVHTQIEDKQFELAQAKTEEERQRIEQKYKELDKKQYKEMSRQILNNELGEMTWEKFGQIKSDLETLQTHPNCLAECQQDVKASLKEVNSALNWYKADRNFHQNVAPKLELANDLAAVVNLGMLGKNLVKWAAQGLIRKFAAPTAVSTLSKAKPSLEASSSLNRLNLQKSLASEQQLAAMRDGKFANIAGQGTDVPIRDIGRLTSSYGGKPNDWNKISSFKYRAADGSTLETHAYRNVVTGKIVEQKTIIGKGIK